MIPEWRATCPEFVREWASRTPERIFIQEAGGTGISYAGTLDRSLRWAGALQSRGIGAGSRVATLLENCIDGRVFWMALGWLRALDVGVSTLYRGSLLAHALNLSKAEILFADAALLAPVAGVADELEHLKVIIIRPGQKVSAGLRARLPFEILEGDAFFSSATPLPGDTPPPLQRDGAAVVFTSGTTGPSKGVVIPWGALTASMLNQPMEELGADDAIYVTSGSSHVIGRLVLLMCAYRGSTCVVKEGFKTRDFWADIDRYNCKYTHLVGAMTHFLMAEPPSSKDKQHALRLVQISPAFPELPAFCERFGLRARTGYGLSECISPVRTDWNHPDTATCGKLYEDGWPYFEARLVDENDYEVPVGEVGELIIRAREPWSMNLGYLDLPEPTADAWRNGWFHTGDGLRRDAEGYFYFVDRVKDSIRRRGENISSFEVEQEVAAFPGVKECAVVGVKAPDNDEQEIKVFIVPNGETPLDPAELIRFLESRVGRYMVPRYVELIDELPRTPTLRVKKAELRQLPRDQEWCRVLAGVTL